MDLNDSGRVYSDSPAILELNNDNGEFSDSFPVKEEDDCGDSKATKEENRRRSNSNDEKRILRPPKYDKKQLNHDHNDDSDAEIDYDSEDFHQSCLDHSLSALKLYFYNRLEQTILFLGGTIDLLKGWKVQILKRNNGLTLGLLEIFYFNNRGKKFRSRVEVACYLNLMPVIKSIRTMTKDQYYLNAIENRERHLISQQLALSNNTCDEIIFNNDVITLINNHTQEVDDIITTTSATCASTSAVIDNTSNNIMTTPKHHTKIKKNSPGQDTNSSSRINFQQAKDLYFSFGNMVVLDWGRIIQDPSFHTNSQLYPLGFKCLRQEHDVTLDRVVDCLCEIDAVYEGGDGVSVLNMMKNNIPIDPNRSIQPLFRLSVAWHIGEELSIGTGSEQDHVSVRVYEARSPQQAWQAAMLEGLGFRDEGLLSVRPHLNPSSEQSNTSTVSEKLTENIEQNDDNDADNVTDHASGEEEQDEEELLLRMKIREQRRAYFRVLRAEQSAGMQAAVRPRLSLDTVDSFAEELILRLFEGMEGSINCENYMYMDSREREGGKKNMQKCYSKAYTKAKNLDRVIRKNVYLSEQIYQLEQKRKRMEDNEIKKRSKMEDKETKLLIVTAQKSRNLKIKELEKNITALKVSLSKMVKKRRDDAKLLAEVLCDREEIQRFTRTLGLQSPEAFTTIGNATSSNIGRDHTNITTTTDIDEAVHMGSRPEPIQSAVVLEGHVIGRLLEVWEFLNTFPKEILLSSADQVPTIDSLIAAVKVFDPAYKSIRAYTKSLDHCFDKVSQFQVSDPFESDASELLNRLGMNMTSVLLRDFERIMGIDVAELQLGTLRIPVNTLTWREISRIVLLNTCCREVGVSEADVAALVKGRGFFTTPESADRKVLKLARRRIKFAYLIRSELQESVYGFSSGLCVHLPAPSVPYYEGTVVWSDLIASLTQVPDRCGWLIYELIKAAALSVCIIDTTPAAKKLKRALQSTLGLLSFRMDNGAETKAAALQILAEEVGITQKWKLSNGRWKSTTGMSSDVPSSSEGQEAPHVDTTDTILNHDEAAQSLRGKLELVYNQTPYMIPTSTFDLWEKQVREALRHANLGVTTEETAENLDEPDSERDLTSAMDEDAGEDGGVEVQSESVKDEEDQTNAIAQAIDDDTKQAEKLSIAMQRCYLVIRDLMLHPQAHAFNWPVDHTVLPAYYKSIAQPLSFSDVRKYLVEGQYTDSIFDFYTDVLMVIENAMAYNQENSSVKMSAQKLLIVFERLFFETVLCWDNPLPFQDCCHACRSSHPITDEKAAVCDRCEGSYHLHCLDPPLQIPPRSEWYCLSCVEQKGIPSAHPYKTADVVHPMDPQSRGEVVGIEQIRQTVMFVVEFGSVRELWDGKKVRKYALEPMNEELIAPKGSFTLHDDADVNKGVLGFLSNTTVATSTVDNVVASSSGSAHSVAKFEPIVSESVYHMPSGYSYEDYDRVCGIARAYTGWGASHYLIPPVLMDQHNLAAQARSKHDAMFPQYRECIAALGFAAGGVLGDTMSAAEWSTVLNSLLHRILDGSVVSDRLAQLDDAVDDDLIAQIQDGVHSNSLPLEKIFGFVRGEGLVKQVKPVEVEPSSDAPRRGRKRRVDILAAAAKLAAAAAGEDEDAGEEDGEDEWDEDMDEIVPVKEVKKEKATKGSKKAKRISAEDEEEEMVFDEPNKPSSKTSSRKDANEETDSADEDDLEFYDADGNCLTSGVVDITTAISNTMSPPGRLPSSSNAQSEYGVGCDLDGSNSGLLESPSGSAEPIEEKPAGPETEDEWNLRLLSRQKGREDALLTHILVYDMLTQLDLDGLKERDEEVFKLVQLEDIGGDFFTHATNAIVKSCLGRPSESLVATEWTRGWETKMIYMQKYLQEYSLQEKEIVCPICGFEEGYLGSPLVWGQTSEEWEADVAADTAQDVLTEPEAPSETNAFPLAAGVSASTGIKGFRARYRVMKGLCWMPYDEADAQIEGAECLPPKRGLKKGSLVMHECCANFVHFNRQIKHDKSRKIEDQRIVEVISGIGRAKCTPIGADRDGSFYWIFNGSNALYVSHSEYNSLRENAAVKRPLGTSRWSVYTTAADIHDVLVWLDPKISTERILKKILSLLFPRALAESVVEELKPVAVEAEHLSSSMPSAKAEAITSVADMNATEAGSSDENLMEISPGATPTAQLPVLIPRALPRPLGSLLLSGDIMEQSGDEGNSGDETDHPALSCSRSSSSRKVPAEEEMDCDEESAEIDALKESEKHPHPHSSADAGSARELSMLKLRKEHATDRIRQRPTITQRSELLQIFAPVDNPLPVVNSASNPRSAAFKYRKGEHVLVDSSVRNHILWDAHVLETKATRINELDVSDTEVVQINLYKLRFARWGSAYDGWYEECQLLPSGATLTVAGHAQTTTRSIAQESKINFIRQNVWTAPEILQSLQASQFLKEPMRACGTAPPLSYSDCQSAMGQLRAAMLLIEAALPIGAVDESDDRWGDDFVTAWREAVAVASDAISLMQCQLMLEYGIRTSWLKPAGLKMFSCLPSRAHCLRNATLGMVAIRVWVLDMTVKYDQVKKEEKTSGNSSKGRPPKHPSGGAGRPSSSAKKGK